MLLRKSHMNYHQLLDQGGFKKDELPLEPTERDASPKKRSSSSRFANTAHRTWATTVLAGSMRFNKAAAAVFTPEHDPNCLQCASLQSE